MVRPVSTKLDCKIVGRDNAVVDVRYVVLLRNRGNMLAWKIWRRERGRWMSNQKQSGACPFWF